MPKNRQKPPRAIRDKVLQEFNHHCAICGADRPQLHHIDEDPSNNDPMNLIPLCPNCHLVDQHNPTKPIEPEKLGLFRRFKDPTILKPQVHPLFVRLQFLNSINDDSQAEELAKKASELVDFIKVLEMGSFYAKRITELISMPFHPQCLGGSAASDLHYLLIKEKHAKEYREQLYMVRDQVYSLVIELTRYQPW